MMIRRISDLSPFKKGLIAFGISFILMLLFVFLKNIIHFPWDSNYYFWLSQEFVVDGSFSFLNFPNTYRGYVFPFLLFLMRGIGTVLPFGSQWDTYAFRFFASAFFAFTLTIVLPYFFTLFCKREIGIIPRVVVVCLTVFFFPGLLLYPLSDFYAFAFIVFALSILLYVEKAKDGNIVQYAAMLSIGLLLYCAYNARPAYVLAAAFTVGLGIVVIWKKKGWELCCIFFALLGCGWMVAAFPQILINNQYHDSWSFAVLTESPNYKDGIALFTLNEGIRLQLYASSLDDIHYGGLRFMDPVGMNILEVEGGDIRGIGEYIKLLLSYPLEFIGIYTRHLINYLNPIDGEVYVSDLHKIKSYYTLINYVLMYITVLGLIARKFRKVHTDDCEDLEQIGKKWERVRTAGYLLPLIIPCLTVVITHVETRYFIPFYILMYGYFAFAIGWKALWALVRRRYVVVALSFFTVLFVFIAIWSSTYANARGVTMFMR